MRRPLLSTLCGTLLVSSTLLSGCTSVSTTLPLPADASPQARGPSARVRPASWERPASVSTRAVEPGTPVRTSAAARLIPLVLAQAEPKKDVDPAALFARLGCTLCHAPGARYHERLVNAAGKSEQELARWIRNPEQFVPGTTMPTYASLIDEPTALALARWIKAGGPASRK